MLVTKILASIAIMFSATTTVPIQETPAPINPCSVSVEKCVEKYFPEDPKLAIAVFKAESQLNPQQIGYNCRYERFDKKENATTTYITSCKPSDRERALSYDVGIAQINSQHDKDMKKYLDTETNLIKARQLYDERKSFNPWYAYRDKKYVQYLE